MWSSLFTSNKTIKQLLRKKKLKQVSFIQVNFITLALLCKSSHLTCIFSSKRPLELEIKQAS